MIINTISSICLMIKHNSPDTTTFAALCSSTTEDLRLFQYFSTTGATYLVCIREWVLVVGKPNDRNFANRAIFVKLFPDTVTADNAWKFPRNIPLGSWGWEVQWYTSWPAAHLWKRIGVNIIYQELCSTKNYMTYLTFI